MDNYLWKLVRNESDGVKIINNNGELVMYGVPKERVKR